MRTTTIILLVVRPSIWLALTNKCMQLLHYCRALINRVVLSEAVDLCICITRKIQHGGDWERSRPQGLKNVHDFVMTVRHLSWACGHGTEMLLLLKIYFRPHNSQIFSKITLQRNVPRFCIHMVNLWLKPVSTTVARRSLGALIHLKSITLQNVHLSCFTKFNCLGDVFWFCIPSAICNV